MLSGKCKLPVTKGHIYRNEGFNNSVWKGAIWVWSTQEKLPQGRWNLLWALKQRAHLESLGGNILLSRGNRKRWGVCSVLGVGHAQGWLEEKTLRCKGRAIMLEKEQWRALIAGDECRSDSLGDEDTVNDLEQERWARFATSWMCS